MLILDDGDEEDAAEEEEDAIGGKRMDTIGGDEENEGAERFRV